MSETTPTSGGGVSGTTPTSGDAGNELQLPLPPGRIPHGRELQLAGFLELGLLRRYMSTVTIVYTEAGNNQSMDMTNLLESLPTDLADDNFEFPSEESEQGDVVSISSPDALDDASDEPAPQPSPPSSTSASDALGDASDEPAPLPSPPSSENSAS